MQKNRIIEVAVSVAFILSLIINLFLGVRYFAGFQYAPLVIKYILVCTTVVIYLSLLYFVFRFLRWLFNIIKNVITKK